MMTSPCSLSSILRAFSALRGQRCPQSCRDRDVLIPWGQRRSLTLWEQRCPHPERTEMVQCLPALFLGETRQNWGWNPHGAGLG